MGYYYRFYVISRNDAGLSNPSSIITLLAANVITESLNLRITYQDEQSITLAWNQPSQYVGSNVTQYIIEEYYNSQWIVYAGTTNLYYSITTNLIIGYSYRFRVRAQNEIGYSPYSNE